MKSYNSCRNSGVSWIGEIPEHWQTQMLWQIADERKQKKRKCDILPVLSLSYGSVVRRKSLYEGLLPASFDNYQVIYPNDIILRLTDLQNDHTSLRTGLVKEKGMITSAYLCVVPKVNASYLHYALHTYDVKKMFYSMGSGVRQSSGWNEARYIRLPIPPCAEQDQIVRFLDWKVSGVNKLMNVKRREIEALLALKQSMVSRVVTRGLSPDAPARFSGVKWLGDIPAHWETVKLRKILSPVSVKNRPDLPLLSVVREQGVILRDVLDKEANHNYIPDDLSGYKVVKQGQFAMNKMKAWQGSYGISDYTGIVSPAYFIFDVAFENLEYFHYAIRSKIYVNFFAQASDGIRVGQWDLQMDKMKEIPFIKPPADEQAAIVDYIKRMLPRYENAIEKLTMEVALLEEYKAKLIADTVTGKMDVRSVEIPEYEYVEDSAEGPGYDGERDGERSEEDRS